MRRLKWCNTIDMRLWKIQPFSLWPTIQSKILIFFWISEYFLPFVFTIIKAIKFAVIAIFCQIMLFFIFFSQIWFKRICFVQKESIVICQWKKIANEFHYAFGILFAFVTFGSVAFKISYNVKLGWAVFALDGVVIDCSTEVKLGSINHIGYTLFYFIFVIFILNILYRLSMVYLGAMP